MSELRKIVANIETVFGGISFPPAFLAAYDQMECLASHNGRETFLVRRKADGLQAVAKCYDRKLLSEMPDITLLQSVQGGGIPEYYEKFESDSMICVIREYIEGTPLNLYAREKQLTKPEILSIADGLCAILEKLHDRVPPLIHRDIKPENIIIRPDGGIALIDFDISREYREGLENDTTTFGTRGYAPPEQYGFEQTDQKADIYAFGVMLRWLMTGNIRPNQNISMDPGIQRVIDRCTAFSPDQRYADIHQVRNDLKKVASVRPKVSRGQILAVMLAAILFFCAGFFSGRYTELFRSAPKEPPIVFTEPLIEAAVRSQLGLEKDAPLSDEGLAQVKRIYIVGTDVYNDPDEFYRQDIASHTRGQIHSLDDLTMLPNLEEVHLMFQGDVNISALSRMENLRQVDLRHLQTADISSLADLKTLRLLVLFDMGLSDVSILTGCEWLETLDVGFNYIRDMKQIGTYENLRSLCLRGLEMETLDGIETMTNLRGVTLAKAEIGDLSALLKLPKLEQVYATPELLESLRTLFSGTAVEVVEVEN